MTTPPVPPALAQDAITVASWVQLRLPQEIYLRLMSLGLSRMCVEYRVAPTDTEYHAVEITLEGAALLPTIQTRQPPRMAPPMCQWRMDACYDRDEATSDRRVYGRLTTRYDAHHHMQTLVTTPMPADYYADLPLLERRVRWLTQALLRTVTHLDAHRVQYTISASDAVRRVDPLWDAHVRDAVRTVDLVGAQTGSRGGDSALLAPSEVTLWTTPDGHAAAQIALATLTAIAERSALGNAAPTP